MLIEDGSLIHRLLEPKWLNEPNLFLFLWTLIIILSHWWNIIIISSKCGQLNLLASVASQMDYSPGGDFPSIAVSINHHHHHHRNTLRKYAIAVSINHHNHYHHTSLRPLWDSIQWTSHPSFLQIGLGQYAGVGPIKTFGHLVPLARWYFPGTFGKVIFSWTSKKDLVTLKYLKKVVY